MQNRVAFIHLPEPHCVRTARFPGGYLSLKLLDHPSQSRAWCIFRGKSATDSGMKSATDSDLISAILI
jgi:hypothetical protein